MCLLVYFFSGLAWWLLCSWSVKTPVAVEITVFEEQYLLHLSLPGETKYMRWEGVPRCPTDNMSAWIDSFGMGLLAASNMAICQTDIDEKMSVKWWLSSRDRLTFLRGTIRHVTNWYFWNSLWFLNDRWTDIFLGLTSHSEAPRLLRYSTFGEFRVVSFHVELGWNCMCLSAWQFALRER